MEKMPGAYIVDYSNPLFPHIFWKNVYKGIYDTDPEQYIGFKDSNHQEIFEGDIVEVIDYGDVSNYVVEFDEEIASFMLRGAHVKDEFEFFSFLMQNQIKVIGNIHENRELLSE